MKQTAVEWFIKELFKKIDYIQVDPKLIEQAKEMEKEQMKEMYLKGIANYDPTFK
jgi:HEPN domain-containing protein